MTEYLLEAYTPAAFDHSEDQDLDWMTRRLESRDRNDPFRNLALSVMCVTVKEAKQGKATAIHFLTNDSEGLRFWCQLLDLDPVAVASRARARFVKAS